MAFVRLLDREGDWLRQSFLAPRQRLNMLEQRKQYYGEAKYKFVDTALGGNFYINTPPQFTRYCDLRVSGRFQSQSSDGKYMNNPDSAAGMGQYYSESIDDNALLVNLRFGVPEFNSLSNFFTGFYNPNASAFARTGRGPGFFFAVGNVFGTILTLPFQPLILVGDMWRFLAQTPASKFYYMKPTMPLYWSAVQTMVTSVAVNMGIIPPVIFNSEQQELYKRAGDGESDYSIDASHMENISQMMSGLAPDLFGKDGSVNVYAVANRAGRLAKKHSQQMSDLMDSAVDSEDLQKKLAAYQEELISLNPSNGIDVVLKKYLESANGSYTASDSKTGPDFEATGRATATTDPKSGELKDFKEGWVSQAKDFYMAEVADASDFVGFRVNNFGQVSESFSNTTKQSELMGKLNGMSSQMRSTRFSWAEGNFGDGVIAGTLESIVGAAKDVVMGTLNGIEMSGLAALAGSAFVDIPEQWENSVAQMPSTSFTINLRTPYGNKISRLQNLIIPLCMLLAGALPLSTGPHSYTAPFLCQYFCKGRGMVRLGLIDSLSITRGVGNLGWTPDGEPLGIDITVSIKDLSSIMHMPIGGGFSLNPLKGILDEDSAYNDYLAVLGSLGVNDLIYNWRRMRLALTKSVTNWKMNSFHNPAKFANWANGTLPGRWVNAFVRELDRPGSQE